MVHPQCTQLSPLVVRPLIIEAKIHQDHPLTLARKLNSFTCDACGKEGRGMFYFCVECSFVVHLRCASLPLHVKVIRHEHPLSLNIYSDPSAPAINPSSLRTVCRICVSMVDTDDMFYYCSTCHDFVAHLHCATCKEERDEGSVESSTSLLEHEEHGTDESTDMSPYVVIKRKLGVDGIEIDAEIKHFSHEHDLKLTDKFETKEKCDACTRYIFTNPYYACAQCRFFLHKYCAELERTMRHPLHEHRLKLIPRTTSELGYFRCWACSRFECNGFTYYCEKCDFNLDVQCSLLSYKYYTHDSHEHRLILSRLTEEGKKCNHCDSNDRKALFCCADCEFALDFKCLTLPHKAWYGQHEHPFTLCYAPEDDSGEYYCDICEEERDPRHWFYYCADCIYPIHPECILGKSPNIKPGKTYTIDNHQHPLTFHVKKTYDDGRDFMCKVCVYPIEHFGYQCAECNFIVHPVCFYKIGKSEG
ncbi:uncharacterized protein LOC121259573 [Juglans microcarpa x Juglans regia]|uniref:uncharacterized protein LOC121259573 n=1 Tax=Juglans microcarpa x Juglans regia TaxID=2249226 RepID=UPI001B7F4FFD|nr:uncharacterized protein LOC121259573 [Juglans microcarpa x Juglans regia]